VPIEPPAIPGSDAQPNDLSHALLRSVSPMYRQYLRNMGVRATLVTTLMKNGRLWGLISCHHHAGPRHLPQPTRAGCELLAHTLSMLLAAKEDREQADYRHALAAMREALTRSLTPRCPLAPTLCHGTPSLLDAIDADGAAACFGTDLHCTGRTPPREMLPALFEWLAAQPDSEIFATDRLGECYPPMAAQSDTAAGLLALRLTREQPGFILWFRPEQARTVSWAGDPRKPAEVELDADGQERLTPRRSFELWRDEVRGRSRPWLDCEREHARLLRASLVDVVLAQADEILRVNRELARSNVELEAFAYAASHDLKEPLRGIHNAAELLSRSAQIRLNDEEHARLATVSRLARRMDELIDSLLHYSRVGRVDLELADSDLGAVLAHALDALADRIAERNVQLTLRPLPRLRCDRVRVEEVLRNLLANAIKYTDRAAPRIEVGSVELAGIGGTAIYVRDDGIGIAPRHHEQIFQIFRRLHGRDEYGGGAGAGLTIARRSVERHGGRLWVESEPGAGATFFFTLGPPTALADTDALPPSSDHAG
jgi:light-regulated signal transduction histidine kinase (bacteriophytochrome)